MLHTPRLPRIPFISLHLDCAAPRREQVGRLAAFLNERVLLRPSKCGRTAARRARRGAAASSRLDVEGWNGLLFHCRFSALRSPAAAAAVSELKDSLGTADDPWWLSVSGRTECDPLATQFLSHSEVDFLGNSPHFPAAICGLLNKTKLSSSRSFTK